MQNLNQRIQELFPIYNFDSERILDSLKLSFRDSNLQSYSVIFGSEKINVLIIQNSIFFNFEYTKTGDKVKVFRIHKNDIDKIEEIFNGNYYRCSYYSKGNMIYDFHIHITDSHPYITADSYITDSMINMKNFIFSNFNKNMNYDLRRILEEEKRFWITNMLTSISTIVGLVYLLGKLNESIFSEFYNKTLSDLYISMFQPKAFFLVWMIIVSLQLFKLSFPLIGMLLDPILFKEYKENFAILFLTSSMTIVLILFFLPRNLSIYLKVTIILLLIDDLRVLFLIIANKSRVIITRSSIVTSVATPISTLITIATQFKKILLSISNKLINRTMKFPVELLVIFAVIENLVMFLGSIKLILSLERPSSFEIFKIWLEICLIIILVLLILTRWIIPSFYKLKKILIEIEKLS